MAIPLRSKGSPSREEAPFDLGPPEEGRRQPRWPEITVGLFLVAVFALAGSWFYTSSTDRVPVIALRDGIERGDVVAVDDLRVVQVDADTGVNVLGRDQSGLVVGRVALTDLAAGTLITPEQFAPTAAIIAGEGVVGLALDPGEYPTLNVRPGDTVRVIEVPRVGEDATPGDLVIVEVATVVDVGPIGVQNQLFVSLSMPVELADLVAVAGADDRVRLVQVEPQE